MPELPRVLLCSFDVVPAPTGSAWRTVESLRALAPYFQVVALTVKTPDLTHIQTLHGARLLRVPVADAELEVRLETFARAVRRQLESEEYALVLFTDAYTGQVLFDERAARGHRLVFDASHLLSTEAAFDAPEGSEAKRFVARLRRQELTSLMNADAVLAASPLTRSHLEGLGVSPEKLHVMRTPTGLAGVPPPLPTSGEGLRLVYVGSAAPWQGLDTLLEGVARARTQVRLHLRVVAPEHPTHLAHLRAKADSLGLTPETFRLEAAVPRERLTSHLHDADLGVLPLTRCERNELIGAPLAKLGDYFGAGRGVVAADVAAARAVLNDEVASFFVASDAEALAAALVHLAKSPEQRVLLGEKGRRYAEERLGLMAFRRRLRDLCHALLGIEPGLDVSEESSGEPTQVHDDFAPTLQRPNLRAAFEEGRTQLQEMPARTDPELRMQTPASLLPEIPPPASEPAPSSETQAPPTMSPAGAPLDPWQALVLYGYCPPPTGVFSRPPPPTTFPGREVRGPRPPSLPSMPAVRPKE